MDTKQYSWADIDIRIAGYQITTAQSISYKESQTKETVYGKGNEPIGIQRGQKSYSGSITLLQSEYDALVATTKNKSILDVHFDAVVSYGNSANGDKITTDILQGCEFTDAENKLANNETYMKIELPFTFLRLKKQK